MIHKNFTLNNTSFNSEKELLAYAMDLPEEVRSFLEEWFHKDAFVVVQTSGSTGIPKSIQLKKEYMINSAIATGEFFNIRENTTALLCLSVNYIAGKMMLVRALVLGWNLDIVAPVSNPLLQVDKEYDFTAMVPLQLQNSLNNLHKVKKLIVGGGVVDNSLLNKIQKINTQIFATYGMTETITHIAVKQLNHVKETPNFYKVLPNVIIYKDRRNCLVIKASKVAKELIITNDVVQLISEKQFEWLGRYDNVINSGGIKLHPEKIEKKLDAIINERFFVAGVFDVKLGEKLILVIEGTIFEKEELEENILNLSLLNKFEIPKEIYFVNHFIETETKKIQRKKTLDLIGL